jgi:hypothetical protein
MKEYRENPRAKPANAPASIIPDLVTLFRTTPTTAAAAIAKMKRTIASVIYPVEAALPRSKATNPPIKEKRIIKVKKVTPLPIDTRTHTKYLPPKSVTRAPNIRRTTPTTYGLLLKYLMTDVT